MAEVLGSHITWRDRADLGRGWVLCAALTAVTLAYSFQLTSFLHAKEAALSASILLLALLAWFRGGFVFEGMAAFLPLWGAVVFTLLLAPAHVPSRSVEEALRIVSLLFCVALAYDLLAQPYWRRRILQAIRLSAALAAALGIGQYLGWLSFLFPVFPGYDQPVYSVFGNQDLFGGYLALALPLYVSAFGRKARPGARAALQSAMPKLLALGLILAALVLSGSRSAWIAAFAGCLIVFPFRHCLTRRGALVLCVAAAALLVTGAATWPRPWERLSNTFSASDTGGRIRLWIWDGSMRMLRDAPWCGWGLGNFGYWSPRYLAEALNAPGGEKFAHNELDTPDAHCEPLQCAAETGMIGVVAMAWMLLRLLRRRGEAWGGLLAFLLFSIFNAAWHSAPHALAGLLLAGMLLNPEAKTPLAGTGGNWLAGLSGVLVAAALAAASCWTTYFPSCLQSRAEAAHCAGQDPLPLYGRVFEHGWPNAQCHEEAAMALLDAGRPVEAREHLGAALEGLDTGRAYWLLGRAAEAMGDRVTARAAYRACLERWPSSEEAWMRLYRSSLKDQNGPLLEHARRWGITARTSE